MKIYRLAAAIPIVIGVIDLTYDGLPATPSTQETSVGSLGPYEEDTERAKIPAWAGVGGIMIGGLLFFFRRLPYQENKARSAL